jgi:hypothetical protein
MSLAFARQGLDSNKSGPCSREEKTMEHRRTILYIFDRSNRNGSVLAAIKETECEVISTDEPTQGIALLYILGQVRAVVLDSQVRKHANFDVAESLRKIRPRVSRFTRALSVASFSQCKYYFFLK